MKIARYVVSISALTLALSLSQVALAVAAEQPPKDWLSEADKAWQKEFDIWRAAAKSGKLDDYKKYLAAYPSGKFASVAKRRIEKLQADTAAKPSITETAGVTTEAGKNEVETRGTDFREPAKVPEAAQNATPDAADTEAEPATAETGNSNTAGAVAAEAKPVEEKKPVEAVVKDVTGPAATSTTANQQASPAEDKDYETWKKAAAANTEEEYKSYLGAYPEGTFAALAKARIVQLEANAKAEVKTDVDSAAVPIQLPPRGSDQTAKKVVEPESGSDVANVSKNVVPDEQANSQSVISKAMEFEAGLTLRAKSYVQKRLGLLGYNAGVADGSFGPRTRAAIAKWQTDNGFEPTGYLQKPERKVLNQQTLESFARLREREKAEQKRYQAEQRALRREREMIARRERQREYIIEDEIDPYDPYYPDRRVYRVYPDEY